MVVIGLVILHKIQNGGDDDGCWHLGSRFRRVAINTTVSVPVSVLFLYYGSGR